MSLPSPKLGQGEQLEQPPHCWHLPGARPRAPASPQLWQDGLDHPLQAQGERLHRELSAPGREGTGVNCRSSGLHREAPNPDAAQQELNSHHGCQMCQTQSPAAAWLLLTSQLNPGREGQWLEPAHRPLSQCLSPATPALLPRSSFRDTHASQATSCWSTEQQGTALILSGTCHTDNQTILTGCQKSINLLL